MQNLKLKAKIIEKYGTQISFSRKLKKHTSFISLVLRGHKNLEDREKRRWARLLKSTPEELFG